MKSKRTFEIYLTHSHSDKPIATIIIEGAVTGAEQNLVILDSHDKPVAVVELQPGYDRREV